MAKAGLGGAMSKIRALFWDVGGVLLTNAWDHEERDQAVERFLLSKSEFDERHKEVVPVFEEGKLTLDEYLDRVVFYQPRTFSKEEFKQFMFSLSRPKSQSLELARALGAKYVMGTINNESRELNQYRIENCGLNHIFDVFVSSCFVGLRKPDERIYRLAMDLTQHTCDQCCFIDDRPVNIEGATKVGMKTVLMKDPQQLRRDLGGLGIEP
jgi:putative hydrolase of the HAD superfamily